MRRERVDEGTRGGRPESVGMEGTTRGMWEDGSSGEGEEDSDGVGDEEGEE